MRTLSMTTQFRRDYRREKRTDRLLDEVLQPVIEMLASDGKLPAALRDHGMNGGWKGFRDCHVRPDLVLIYGKVGKDHLNLVRLGSHAQLFG
jgi:mRNA interferase YafQ